MIDTPGHMDFTYKVSRSLAVCGGAVLLIDVTQDTEAQTLANLYLALENGLMIILVLNGIDLPGTQPEKYAHEVTQLTSCDKSGVLKVSDKTGEGAEDLLDRIVEVIPASEGAPDAPMHAIIFDSVYDTHRGVVTYACVVGGVLSTRQRVHIVPTGTTCELLELGVISPEPKPEGGTNTGEAGYLITDVKNVRQSRAGDTVISQVCDAAEPFEDYRDPNPMISSGIYPVDGSGFPGLYDTPERLQLNNVTLTSKPESSTVLGFGFRCDFPRLLHLKIIHERLEQRFNLDLIATIPNVIYHIVMEDDTEVRVNNLNELPGEKISEVREPVVNTTILAPTRFMGAIMELCQERRGLVQDTDYLSEDRMELHYRLPLAEVIFDFSDQLKSCIRGYALLDYQESGGQSADLVKADILLSDDRVNALGAIVHRDGTYNYGQHTTRRLKGLTPRQQFEIPIQAIVSVRVITRKTIKALRRDMLTKCYGGDISHKHKLLEKQKEGKKRMKSIGHVGVPRETSTAALIFDVPTGKK